MSPFINPQASYWRNIIIKSPGECWEYKKLNGAYVTNDYGKDKNGLVHRQIMAFILGKPIPKHLAVMHLCDNPSCCNPLHLVIGTHAANMYDSKKKGRKKRPSHWKHPATKLTQDEARQIREEHAKGISKYALAKTWYVHYCTINEIVNGDAYAEAGGPIQAKAWQALTEKSKRELIKRRLQGEKLKSLSAAFGITMGRVSGIMKDEHNQPLVREIAQACGSSVTRHTTE